MTLYCLGRGVRVLIENLVCLRRESLQGLERRERVNDSPSRANPAGRKGVFNCPGISGVTDGVKQPNGLC